MSWVAPFRHRVVRRFGLPDAPRNVPPISSGRTPSEDTTRKLFRQSKPFGIVERKLFSAKEKGFRISSKALLAEDTRFRRRPAVFGLISTFLGCRLSASPLNSPPLRRVVTGWNGRLWTGVFWVAWNRGDYWGCFFHEERVVQPVYRTASLCQQ